MSKSEIEKHYKDLKSKIAKHDHLYYVLDRPELTDFEYDQLYRKLLELEERHPELDRSDSPSQRITGQALEAFKKVPHRIPMLSLSNSFSNEDIEKFDERVQKFLNCEEPLDYEVEPKFDGLAIELVYESGLLTQASTRGDGSVGEDVSQNVKTVKSIPLRLNCKTPPPLLEVRGEILMLKQDFLGLNNRQQESGETPFANPRNAAAGSIRQLDPAVTRARPLRFFAYALGAFEGPNFETQAEMLDQFAEWGLPVIGKFRDFELRKVVKGAYEVIEFYQQIDKIRLELPFEIDGIVIKLNDRRKQEDLGFVGRSPRWATAAKFKPLQAQTVVESIMVSVGRTGALTPVAVMKPVKVGGVTIVNATLHNQDELDRKDVRVGDTVIIHRAGDVIPEVVSVLLEKRPPHTTPFMIPDHCPVCQKPVVRSEGEVVKRCVNPLCPAIVKESLKHFVSRRAMNIDKVGDKIVEILVDKQLVRSFSDFYRLKKEDLLSLERQGEKSAQNILDSIEKSKGSSLTRLIFALGIRFVGEQTAKALADHFGDLDSFLAATEADLLSIPDIGPKVANSILLTLANKELGKEAKSLLQLGVQLGSVKRVKDGPFSSKSFLITGTLPVKRDEAKVFIEERGGKILSSVSSKLDFLVVGEDPGSKLEKAQGLGVSIIGWEELVKMGGQ